jgi:hypothetical protein
MSIQISSLFHNVAFIYLYLNRVSEARLCSASIGTQIDAIHFSLLGIHRLSEG